MKKTDSLIKLLMFLVIMVSMNGCALFKYKYDTGDVPINPKEMMLRIQTRNFYYSFGHELMVTADSICAATDDIDIQLRAIEWKISALKGITTTTMQSYPEMALIDTWLFLLRMEQGMNSTADGDLFGPESHRAREFMAAMVEQVETLAKTYVPEERIAYMQTFIEEQMAEYPSGGYLVNGDNTSLEWSNFLKKYGNAASFPIGTITEVSTDLSDKAFGQIYSLSQSLGWSQDMWQLQLKQDSISDNLIAELAVLEKDFQRLVHAVEHAPETSAHIMKELTLRIDNVLHQVNHTLDHTFALLDKERNSLEHYVTYQSDTLLIDAQKAADEVVDRALKMVPNLMGELMIYVGIFFLILIAVPFVIGFFLGRVRRKKKGTIGSDDDSAKA